MADLESENAPAKLEREADQIKFFIHDLRVQKFFHHLISIHQNLMSCYQEAGLSETMKAHQDYMARLKSARARAHEARMTYELAVKSEAGSEEVIRTGRRYIDATLETCRISLLPHWRDFDVFVQDIPQDAQCRRLKSAFNEVKAWIGSIDRRIVNFTRFRDREVPMQALAVSQRIWSYVQKHLRYYVRSAGGKRLEVRLGRLDPGFIYADRPRFDRLLFNLVMNAVDAMRHKRTGQILVEVKSTDLVVNLEVTDEGVGMSKEKVEQILHSEHDLTRELHSLGFRFVRQTVIAFTGKIYVESEEGKGTKITLSFPHYHTEEDQVLSRPFTSHAPTGEAIAVDERRPRVAGADQAGQLILDDYRRSLAPLPGCIFSIAIALDGMVDHFVHRAYDPDWMMGHDDLAPILYEAVFRGRHETDDKCGTALILKSPHKLEEYWDLRQVPRAERDPEQGLRMIHNEYVLIARHLIQTGMDPSSMVYITKIDPCFTAHGQSFSGDPFPLSELADQELLAAPQASMASPSP